MTGCNDCTCCCKDATLSSNSKARSFLRSLQRCMSVMHARAFAPSIPLPPLASCTCAHMQHACSHTHKCARVTRMLHRHLRAPTHTVILALQMQDNDTCANLRPCFCFCFHKKNERLQTVCALTDRVKVPKQRKVQCGQHAVLVTNTGSAAGHAC